MPDTHARYYRLATPAGREASVRVDQSTVTLQLTGHRPIVMSTDDAWAAWAVLADGLGFPESAPEWVDSPIRPTDADGQPLTAPGVPV